MSDKVYGKFDELVVVGNISSTQGGSAAAPKFCLSGSTTTGLFTPAADAVGVATAGVERARITAAGNLLVGTTTDNGARLQVAGTMSVSTLPVYADNTAAAALAAGMMYRTATGVIMVKY